MVADSVFRWRATTLALCAAFGQLAAWVVGTVTQMNHFAESAGWWRTARVLWSILTPAQSAALLLWAGITGVLLMTGARGRARHRRVALAAFGGGALVPVGLTLLRAVLGRAWPGLDAPLAASLTTLCLVLYSVLVPWLIGRFITRARPTADTAVRSAA
jgi:hypothetical protein